MSEGAKRNAGLLLRPVRLRQQPRFGCLLLCGLFVLMAAPAEAARIGDFYEVTLWEQTLRFFSMPEGAVRNAVLAAALMGISCGLMGSYMVVRRLSLMGDVLAHAVMPGVALGFLWAGTKDPLALFIGAVGAGLVGSVLLDFLKRTTRIKEDSLLAMILSGFYAVGICLFTMIQRQPSGNKAGLEQFLFGQAAAVGSGDLILMGVIALLVVGVVVFLHKELLACSFDPQFSQASGLPARFIQQMLLVLLTFVVVASLQAVGIILVSALLIIPAATAYLLVRRFQQLLLVAVITGVVSGISGAYVSYLGSRLPTGPFMVLAAALLFALALLFSPLHGYLPLWFYRRQRDKGIRMENALKRAFQLLESGQADRSSFFSGDDLSMNPAHEVSIWNTLQKKGLATYRSGAGYHLTDAGWERGRNVVRKHRLWEQYLTEAANYPPDHVHEDAEQVEHLLEDDTVHRLRERLGDPGEDPHGKPIPRNPEGVKR